MIAVLCGGVGGSRFLRSLSTVIDPERITAIVNTGDDDWFHGLYVSPDPDIVTYALAGEIDDVRGWGLRGDTFRWLQHLERFGHETWFKIGDRDLATHIRRSQLLHDGHTLAEVTEEIRRAYGVRVRILPMSNDRVRTIVETDTGDLPFQEFLVKRQARDAIRGVRYSGADRAHATPGVLEALREAEAIFIAPSNPIGSIGPILAVPGIRATIASARVMCVAVSPIIAGRSLQPPTAELMAGLQYPVDVTGVAAAYRGLIDMLFIDEADAQFANAIEVMGIKTIVMPTLLVDNTARLAFGEGLLRAIGIARK